MKQGIQTNFPHESLREYGCYFFALLRWAEIITGNGFDVGSVLRIFEQCKLTGWVEDDCFVVNPVAVLNHCIGTQAFRVVYKSGSPNSNTFAVYLKKPGHGHFILSHNGETWDSLDPGRPGVKDYKVDSYRVIA